jgi:ABC-type branched-subunit amino acid transport system ATPase component
MSPVIEVRQLHKRYGDTVAVDDVSFSVADGELQLLTMAGWAVAFGLAAARFFRWE